ncbi:RdgB/HAM1 family non-canonical purine NTP pyrophosphatase [Polynucleobacter paneuropaeus]|jgi:XTP/dITP diphosphohydrolase|uniref:dITP/XTP pyrophosphatase n=1 Tax=Polynucleobacter paneuropaeus TaxID=2527775 RepID=A0A2Z4JMM1_9BURK|nr:RdgB/HAM1 family non-canonical purine NTP pyrophosphatase [Polynucleobacter paneuropaeus]AWW44671.1 non-canonical purine NTP pyrophosphatase, RdgB/HAM1 family [Polynucleobacter paneuropaeus]AWW46316.1 non-canonical purine NTP pyrophosphatase, RdgB/HAM1 family [Polynucleobacter paneuropaeus]AWW48155.1 non-canonical purine NTP pyrophosphatase, RdgB/HAM1 family [Polynucleobacter paneuropaeus]AWW49486.1 non-canonical purine NTP pyrophosphatase, RdgB/HAM1 family [Polynucleobacter paneuropaeus]MB
MQKLVLASNNAGKLKEFSELLAPFEFEVIPQGQFEIPAAEEPFDTFLENALAKAKHASQLSGLPALADDSGICVNVLGGKPGVRSARYAGDHASDTDNNHKLLQDLANELDRTAYYICALVMVNSADDQNPITVQARWDGEVTDIPRGDKGFGYDPYFYIPELGKTAAELSSAEKNAFSHRGQALRILIAELLKLNQRV